MTANRDEARCQMCPHPFHYGCCPRKLGGNQCACDSPWQDERDGACGECGHAPHIRRRCPECGNCLTRDEAGKAGGGAAQQTPDDPEPAKSVVRQPSEPHDAKEVMPTERGQGGQIPASLPATPALGVSGGGTLRERVEREIAQHICDSEYCGVSRHVCIDGAIEVAVRMIEEERGRVALIAEQDARTYWLGRIKEEEKRAEAAEKERDEARRALAKRGHVARCCCGEKALNLREMHDPRCAPETGGG